MWRLPATGLFLPQILPQLQEIIECAFAGNAISESASTRRMDLLRQGAEGYQLTWMDAKVDDWVVTPRRGKAVEINALWYNALCYMAQWLEEDGQTEKAGEMREARGEVPRIVSEAVSGMPRAAICTMWWMARMAMTRRCGRTKFSRSLWIFLCWSRTSGPR